MKLVIDSGDDSPIPFGLLELLATCLHEIVHVLYPTFSEEETERKTLEWLRRFNWEKGLD